MSKPQTHRDPAAAAYQRNAARITSLAVLSPGEKDRLIAAEPARKRGRRRQELEAEWRPLEQAAADEATQLIEAIAGSVDQLASALEQLDAAQVPELRGI